jgi:pimeloyl-ACP methyl ester carboxylesterase
MNVTLINPGRQAGGANLLLARAVSRLALKHCCKITLVDFEDGATRKMWISEGIPFVFSPYEVGGSINIGQADVVIVSLLGARLFPHRLRGNPSSRLLAWCTAPQDPFKFLPPAYFFNGWSWAAKHRIARWFFPAHRQRIRGFLAAGTARGGVIFMDNHCHEVNETLFGPGILPAIVPICTGVPVIGPRIAIKNSGKAYWVGRVTDFKTEPFIAMTKALLRAGSPIKEVVVIGDGADIPMAKARLAGLPVTWRGYVEPSRLNDELVDHADLVYGHATALLEAAKLGIPSLLVDGTYDKVSPSKIRSEWLHRCPAGYVGKIAPAEDLIGRPPEDCLREFVADASALALADYGHWAQYHHPDAIADRLVQVITHGDYTCEDFLLSGAARPGLMGALLDWLKVRVFRREY